MDKPFVFRHIMINSNYLSTMRNINIFILLSMIG